MSKKKDLGLAGILTTVAAFAGVQIMKRADEKLRKSKDEKKSISKK